MTDARQTRDHAPAAPRIIEQRPPSRRGGDHGMVEMARQNEAAHRSPVPGATTPEIDPFPRGVLMASWLGLLLGAIVGLGFAGILLNGLLVVPGWEQLYSMTPGTFATFWTGMGAALGLLIAGVVAIMVVPARETMAARATTRGD